jgi:hypothetical protein
MVKPTAKNSFTSESEEKNSYIRLCDLEKNKA